jgi:hypothetical protein
MLPAEVLPSEDDSIGRKVPKRKLQASHRRALSDGVVLGEERYFAGRELPRDGCWGPQGAQ